MPHHPPERIELDEHLLLRLAVDEDTELLGATVAESLEHLRPWMSWAVPEAATLDAQRRRAQERRAQAESGAEYTYLLVEGAELHGVCGLLRRVGPGAIEIGFWLRPTSVGRGLVTRAVGALTAAALELPDVARVEIHCDEANLRSRAVPERLGYRLDRVEDDGVQAPAEVGRGMVWVYP